MAVLSGLVSITDGFGQIYSYKNITHRNGLPLNSTSSLKEKKDGGILIGTQGAGIIEYDGYNFTEVVAHGEDNRHFVTGIDLIGNDIYFTSRYRGVFKVDEHGKVMSVFSRKDIRDYQNIIAYNQYLFITTSNAFFIFDSKSKKEVHHNLPPLQELHVTQTIATEQGLIFLTRKGHYMFTSTAQFIPLFRYFSNNSQSILEPMKFGYYSNGLLHLFDQELDKGVIVELKEAAFNFKQKNIEKTFDPAALPEITGAVYNNKKKCFTFFSSKCELFEEHQYSIRSLYNNNRKENITATKAICDESGNYWMTTDYSGVFKIGSYPFTKIDFNREFFDPKISFIFKTRKDKIIFSSSSQSSITRTGELYSKTLHHHNLKIISGTYVNNRLVFGTDSGLYEYFEDSDTFRQLVIPGVEKEDKVFFLSHQSPYVWLGVEGKGLYKLSENLQPVKHYSKEKDSPKRIYTGQFSTDEKYLYLGTDNGIVKLDIEKGAFSRISNHKLGYFCGSSVKDVFETNWFTLDKGIIGISKQGELFTLSSPSLFPSYLFYTLNSDNYGNLIIGTNKGLNVIQLNEKGRVINQRLFSSKTGFDGYETYMRASFQTNNQCFVGTVEGMFLLDFTLLHRLNHPEIAPIIRQKSKTVTNDISNVEFHFLSKNPQVANVQYSYRVLNQSDKWSQPGPVNEISLSNLPGGTYTLEVKSTYNGVTYSPVSTYSFEIDRPVLRGNAVILSIILVVFALIIYFYNKSKDEASVQLFYAEEPLLAQKYAPSLVLFAFFSHLLANELAPFITSDFQVNHTLVILSSAFLLITFFLVVRYKNRGAHQKVTFYLTRAYIILMLFYIYSLYESSLHPFYGFSLVIVSSTAPFIIEKTKSIIIYSIVYIGLNTIVIFSTDGLYYDKYLMIIPIVLSALLSIFMSLVRHDSLRQLAFISSIINKSNVLAMAMNKDGKLKYVSKSISNYIDVEAMQLMDESISIFNRFIPEGASSRDIDLKSEFKDGKRFISPIISLTKEITWIEWSCKEFSDDLKVVIGQDITEKMSLQNTYEILVENAEDIIYKADINGNLQFVNNRFYDYLSYDSDILVGRNIMEIVPDAYRTSVLEHYKKQFKDNEKVSYFELPILDKNDQLQWFGQYVTLLFDPGTESKATGFLAVGRNITERMKKDQIIKNQQADITASISYAKRIQMNLLPPEEKINDYFSESFVLYQPKDIVSGDFYWLNQFEHYTILAVGDGTGHGVPGAFLSILGINLLNSIILEKQIHNPGRILDELDIRLKQMLSSNKQDELVNDGIEMAICVFNEETGTVEYACAGAKLILHDGHSFSVRKGDNKHIGDYQNDFQGYVTHHSTIENEMTIYLFTDGFHDQFGGVSNKKFSVKRLLELFFQNISLPMKSQKEMFEKELRSWKADAEQTDDITIIGIRKKGKK